MATLGTTRGLADSGGGNFQAFPEPVLSWDADQPAKGRTHTVPDGNDVRTDHRKGSIRITVRGLISESTPTDNIDAYNSLVTKATSADDLWLIRHRSGSTNQEYYKDVHCEDVGQTRVRGPLISIPWRAVFVAKDPDVYTASPLS